MDKEIRRHYTLLVDFWAIFWARTMKWLFTS